jgi:hypothetical protein
MQLSDLAAPPLAAERLADGEVSNMFELTADELTLSLVSRFTPERVGATEGTKAVTLLGQLEAERQHPGADYQGTELSTHIVMQRVRLGRYRWLLSNILVEPPCVTVSVDRVATAAKRLAPALATNEQCTFWLSTLGVDDLELETRNNPLLSSYSDYVEVMLWSYQQDTYGPWRAHLNARRVLAQHDNASWEHKLALGESHACSVSLGDHKLELLDVVWVNDSAPADVHAHFRLSRGVTAEGMSRSPPPAPYVPHMRP